MCMGCSKEFIFKEFKKRRLVCHKNKKHCHECDQPFTETAALDSKRVHLLKQHQTNFRTKQDWIDEFGIAEWRTVEVRLEMNLYSAMFFDFFFFFFYSGSGIP
jgi:hypothetical protein